MTKQRIVRGIVGGLALLIVGGIVGIWLSLPKFEVENKSSVKRFNVSTIWGNVFLWKMGYIDQVDRVKIIYTDEPQQSYRLNAYDGEEIMSTYLIKQEKNVNITIRYNKEQLYLIEDKDNWFEMDIYAAICMTLEKNSPTEVENCYKESLDYVNWTKSKRIPGIIKNYNSSSFSLVKQAYAQTCVGTIPCGQIVTGNHCVGGVNHHDPCPRGAVDCPGGTCTGGQYCNTTLNNIQCSAISTYAMCVSPTIMVDECAIRCNISAENFCSWSVDGGGGGGGSFCRLGLVGSTTHDCSTGNRSGLNRKVYDAAIQDNNHLTQNDYVCGPRINDLKIDYAGSGNNSTDADSCGHYIARFNGYFYASQAGNYQFLVDVFPNGGFSIDGVNSVPVNPTAPLPCVSPNGTRRVGDRYWAARVKECGNYEPGWALDPVQGGYDGNFTLCRDSATNDYKGVVPGNLFNRNFGTPAVNDTGGQLKFWGTNPFPWYVPYPAPAGNNPVSGSDHPSSAPFIPPYYTQDAWRTPESSECIYNSPTLDRSGFIVPTSSIADLAEEDAGDAKVRLWARRYLTEGYHRVEGWHYWSRWLTGNEGQVNSQLDFYVKRPGDPNFILTRDLPLDASCPFYACDGTPVCTAAPPSAPTNPQPGNGTTAIPTAVQPVSNPTSVTLRWNHSGQWGTSCNGTAKDYLVCEDIDQTVVNNFNGTNNGCDHFYTVSGTSISAPSTISIPTPFSVSNNGGRHYWKVVSRHGDQSTVSPTWSFYAPRVLTINGQQGMDCTLTATSLYPWTSLTFSNMAGWPAMPTSTGPGPLQVLIPITASNVNGSPPPGYIKTCQPNGDPSGVAAGQSAATVRFSAEQSAASWWQVYYGDVGSRIDGVINNIPTNLRTTQFTEMGSAATEGVLLGQSIDLNGQSVGTNHNWQAAPANINFDADEERYATFLRSFEMNPSGPTITSPVTQLNIDSDPTEPDSAFYYEGTLQINQNLNITGSKVIFVNGNVQINATSIDVGPGNFFAIVTNGSITFSGTTRHVEGVYLADINLTVDPFSGPQTEITEQFTGEGIFIGWGGVSLNRNLHNPPATINSNALVNNLNPSHIFTYRPDFLINAPDGFKTSTIQWQEVDPQKELTP